MMLRIGLLALAQLAQLAQPAATDAGASELLSSLAADSECNDPSGASCALNALQFKSTSQVESKESLHGCADGKCDCAQEFARAFETVDRESDNFASEVQAALATLVSGSEKAAKCAQLLKERLSPPETAPGGGYGANARTGWEYSFVNDCFRNGGKCPEGQYCQVFAREQWFPYAESYVNRGRCVAHRKEQESCTGDIRNLDMFGELNSWMVPPQLCGPGLACAKDILVLPGPSCVRVKSQTYPCTQAWPVCGGRGNPKVKNGEIDWKTWDKKNACPSNKTCARPDKGGFDRKTMEVCASKYVAFGLDGENYVFTGSVESKKALGAKSRTMGSLQDELEHNELGENGLPNAETESAEVEMLDMRIQNRSLIAEMANLALEPIWPYPVCSGKKHGGVSGHGAVLGGGPGEEDACTTFPLKRFSDEEVVKALGKHPSSYFCMWGIAHTIFENGGASLTLEQVDASKALVRLYAEAHSCQVCRTNFQHIVHHYGLPSSTAREDHAKWWWIAHNNANEHVYSVHSYPSPLAPRVSDFANPEHMSAWYTPREVARNTWKVEGL